MLRKPWISKHFRQQDQDGLSTVLLYSAWWILFADVYPTKHLIFWHSSGFSLGWSEQKSSGSGYCPVFITSTFFFPSILHVTRCSLLDRRVNRYYCTCILKLVSNKVTNQDSSSFPGIHEKPKVGYKFKVLRFQVCPGTWVHPTANRTPRPRFHLETPYFFFLQI